MLYLNVKTKISEQKYLSFMHMKFGVFYPD